MSFRKVDVDFDDEDQFVDEDQVSAENLQELEAAVDARTSQVRGLLSSGNVADAVSAALENAPAGVPSQAIKDKSTAVVMEAMLSARSTDIASVVKGLSSSQMDVLMKYIYRGMAQPELFNSAVLLTWHEKVLEVGGPGSIVRVLVDRKTV